MPKNARLFTSEGLPPYLQAFLFAMESGAVILTRVMGEDSKHGEGLAQNMAQELCPCQVWAACPYPVGMEERAKGEGAEVLKPAYSKEARKAASAFDLARAIGPAQAGES
jgi:hypothetical protein